MTDYAELVKRLDEFGFVRTGEFVFLPLAHQAARAIEALGKERALLELEYCTLETQRDELSHRLAALEAENEALVKERDEALEYADKVAKRAAGVYGEGRADGREAGIRGAAELFANEATDETAEGWIYIDVVRRILALLKKD